MRRDAIPRRGGRGCADFAAGALRIRDSAGRSEMGLPTRPRATSLTTRQPSPGTPLA